MFPSDEAPVCMAAQTTRHIIIILHYYRTVYFTLQILNPTFSPLTHCCIFLQWDVFCIHFILKNAIIMHVVHMLVTIYSYTRGQIHKIVFLRNKKQAELGNGSPLWAGLRDKSALWAELGNRVSFWAGQGNLGTEALTGLNSGTEDLSGPILGTEAFSGLDLGTEAPSGLDSGTKALSGLSSGAESLSGLDRSDRGLR